MDLDEEITYANFVILIFYSEIIGSSCRNLGLIEFLLKIIDF